MISENNKDNNKNIERIKSLTKFLNYCDQRYFLYNESPVGDENYDLLKEELEGLKKLCKKETESPIFSTIKSKKKAMAHSKPMLSLQKIYDKEELFKFFEKSNNDIVLEMKIDGVSISLSYNKGVFYQALTRGNGKIGEDITEHIFEIKDIPLLINFPEELKFIQDKYENLEVRGELYIKKSVHQTYFSTNSNPRNICSGLINRKYPDKDTKQINFFAYSIIGVKEVDTQEKTLFFLKQLNFPVEPNSITIKSLEDLKKQVSVFEGKFNSLDYNCDGVVLKVNNLNLAESMGYTISHPRGAVAFKFMNKKKATFIEKINWQVGGTGTITPVANINPVEIEGVSIKRVTLHNYSFVKELETSQIIIERAGGVIPKVVPLMKSSEAEEFIKSNPIKKVLGFMPPNNCPCCDSILEKTEKDLMCPNHRNCKEQKLFRLISFCQKLKIQGVGEKQMQILLEKNIVNSYRDILELPEKFPRNPLKDLSTIIWEKFIDQIKKIPRNVDILKAITIAYGGQKNINLIVDALEKNKNLLDIRSIDVLASYFIENNYFTPKIAEIITTSIIEFSKEIKDLKEWIDQNKK